MRVRTGGRSIELEIEGRVKAEGRSVHEQARAPYGALAAPSPLTFVLQMKTPSGKNQVKITRTGRRYPDKNFINWRAKALAAIGGVAAPFPGPVHMIVDYVPGDRIRRDADGMISALFHLIVKAGIMLDDAQVKSLIWREYPVQPNRPRCSVSLREYVQ